MEEIDSLEILTLQDNYVDLLHDNDSKMVLRARGVKEAEVRNSILAEHGFSALASLTVGRKKRSVLFDFGFSKQGVAFNAEALNVDLCNIEYFILSHGHPDHWGGLKEIAKRVRKRNVKFITHPAAFRHPRYRKKDNGRRIMYPCFAEKEVRAMGLIPITTSEPFLLGDNQVLFLGEIPRKTNFEIGPSDYFYEAQGKEKEDLIEDDTAIAINVKGKGLVIISGCAHSGIINTVKYAQALTGVQQVFVIMGGFHLSIADFDGLIKPTAQAFREINPTFIIPCHCTGRRATLYFEKEMPEKFILNMSGTKFFSDMRT
jgi:7,8-dihydropterin-6-yl-methyl-4-(beta-D-ribofuranosyl)aminobenzene 5'-phosphate synthase